MAVIFIADDDGDVRDLLARFLLADGHEVRAFEDGEKLLDAFLLHPCDLAIIDVMMPGMDGIALLDRIRRLSQIPVVVVSAKDADEDYCFGLACGADDYVTKPFKPTLLVAKVRSILQRIDARAEVLSDEVSSWGNLEFRRRTRTFAVAGKALDLTALEYKLLKYYFDRFQAVVTKEELSRDVWGLAPVGASRAVDEANRRLRARLLAAGSTVYNQTVWGHGFRLTFYDGAGS